MNTKTIFFITILMTARIFAMAQDKNHNNHLLEIDGKNKTPKIGFFGGLSVNYTEIFDDPAGSLGAKAGIIFNHKFSIGLAGYGLWYDYRLNDLVQDGTYHMEAGYSGLYLEYLHPLSEKIKLGFSVITGHGIAQYKYDKQYLEGRPWYKEIIDRETFAVFEPGFEIMTQVGSKWWIGANISYRSTSPIKLQGTNEDFLNNYHTGISIRYGIL